MKKDKDDLIIDELLEAYTKDLAEEEFKEFAHYFEEDEQYLANKHLVENVRYEPSKPKKKRTGLAKYAAAAAAVLLIVFVTVPTEASAWRIWDLRFLFSDNSDHTLIRPEDVDKFPQYYVSEIPESFEIVVETINEENIFVQYQNEEGCYLSYMQVTKDQFVSQLDRENREITEEIIGDFKAAVSNNGSDAIFEVVTDSVAIFVQTNAGYECGKLFLKNLKEI